METAELKTIAKLIANEIELYNKDILTTEEVAKYLGISRSHLYKLTMSGTIPHYKPSGKIVYFNREEINKWAMQNRVSSNDEIAEKAEKFCMRGGIAL